MKLSKKSIWIAHHIDNGCEVRQQINDILNDFDCETMIEAVRIWNITTDRINRNYTKS
jgi:hypothetical protein